MYICIVSVSDRFCLIPSSSFSAKLSSMADGQLGHENRRLKLKSVRAETEGDGEDEDDDGDGIDDCCWEGKKGIERRGKRRKKKKRKKRKREENLEEGNVRRDPLVVFGSDVMTMILSHLGARSVALSLLVSRGWHGVASSDRLWTSKCEELWLGKAHIPRLSHIRGLSKLAAYSLSVMDGKRSRIMKEDLRDHVWEFHFNTEAPEYWRNLDPYWKGTGPPMRRYFHPDESLTADPGDTVWGGHESSYSIVTSFIGDGSIREHYVRINRWPRMAVLRKQDWSWEMSNSLYCYSSIPDADKEGGTGPLFHVF